MELGALECRFARVFDYDYEDDDEDDRRDRPPNAARGLDVGVEGRIIDT